MGKQKKSIFEMDVDELKEYCVGLGLPKYIADQVLDLSLIHISEPTRPY